ncbi:HTH-type transcriptional regulator RutR [Paraburkholderia sp. MMS20-SJTR3]|uniref:HTH-type transcriptional regulator RutR n=1 Tax=Paraburkholderia sejongensis TaxID=2886946 RepID=A0ABS8JT38_9BURK|nr:HTH-type transcriptional regulator RutR [Paraburkholderia sp. MMS20-SJTR3]MCC8392893.1 HTH-type transcriptional regulator RutR [Paraburkholderia sp. MMS20-SJTR3]
MLYSGAPFNHFDTDTETMSQAPGKELTSAPRRKRSEASEARRQRQIDEKRRNILNAALELFSTFGFHGTSVDQIAERADVSKGNLLYYFRNKDDLYASLLRDLLALWLEPLRAFSVEQDPVEAIPAYIHQKLIASRDNPAASRLFCIEIMQGAPVFGNELLANLKVLVQEKQAVIEQWIADGKLAPVTPHHLIFFLWATTQHYADFSFQVEGLTGKTLKNRKFFAEVERNLCDIVLAGILPRTGCKA